MPSAAIRRASYDAPSRTLSVWFVPSGLRYDYFEVPTATYEAFRRSGSKGRFFNARIRDHFAFRQMPEAAGPNSSTVARL